MELSWPQVLAWRVHQHHLDRPAVERHREADVADVDLEREHAAGPDPPGSAVNPVASRWIEWFAAGAWRAIGCPSGAIDRGQSAALAHAIANHELRPQIAYHRSTASQAHRLDHRLEWIGTALFGATLLSCVALLAALVADPEWVARNFKWFTIAAAGLPALGTAMLGIRVHGDFAGSAVRSEATANVLEAIAGELDEAGPDLSRAADLAEQAARAMLTDLDEWRLINQQHDLSV